MFPYLLVIGIVLIVLRYVLKRYLDKLESGVSNEKHGPFNGLVLRSIGDADSYYRHLKPEKRLEKFLSILSSADLTSSKGERIAALIRLREFIDSDELPEQISERHCERAISLLLRIQTLLEMQPRDTHTITWRYEETYANLSYDAQSLLALLARASITKVESVLRKFLNSDDPDLACSAAISLLSNGIDLPKENLTELASAAQVRNKMIKAMESCGKINEVPDEYRTTQAIAESALVEWLMFPTELNSVPDEIELEEKVIIHDTSEAEYDFFVFKFRTNPPHFAADNGWLLGVTGPYPRDGTPEEDFGNMTFSFFDRLGTITPEELVMKLVRLATREESDDLSVEDEES